MTKRHHLHRFFHRRHQHSDGDGGSSSSSIPEEPQAASASSAAETMSSGDGAEGAATTAVNPSAGLAAAADAVAAADDCRQGVPQAAAQASHFDLPGGRGPSVDLGDSTGTGSSAASKGSGSVGSRGGRGPASLLAAALHMGSSSRSKSCFEDSGSQLRQGSFNKAVMGAAAHQAAMGRSKPRQHARSATFPRTGAKSALRRPSYAINDLKIDSSSQWGEGVAVIESVLEPGSETEAVLTAEQRLGLRNVQFLLLRHGSDGKEGLRAHIPRALLGSLNEFSGAFEECTGCEKGCESCEGENDIDSDEEESSLYLLSHFGGVTQKKRSTEETKKKIKNVVMAHSFMKNLMGNSHLGKLRVEVFVPPEWKALNHDDRVKLRDMLSWDSLKRWNFNVMELSELSGGHPLLMVGWAILGSPTSQKHMVEATTGEAVKVSKTEGYGYADEFSFGMETLCGFLRAMESEYNHDNPYHNHMHAADVLQTMHSLLQMGGIEFAQADIQSFSILLAAVVHDVGHPGRNNAYEINARSELALRYNDISVLENMHASTAFHLIMGENRDPKIDILGKMRSAQISSIRKIVIDAILHTDMTKHFTMVDQMKGLLVSKDVETEIKKENSVEVLNYMLHLADVSNPAKPAPMFTAWTDRCLAEFFAQGDLEKGKNLPVSPLCDRDKTSRKQSQIGFIQYVVEPAYEVLAKAIPALEDEVLPTISDNLDYWRRLPEEKKVKTPVASEKKKATAAVDKAEPEADKKEAAAAVTADSEADNKSAEDTASDAEPDPEDAGQEQAAKDGAGSEDIPTSSDEADSEERVEEEKGRSNTHEGQEMVLEQAENGEKGDGATADATLENDDRAKGAGETEKKGGQALEGDAEREAMTEKKPPEDKTDGNGSS